MKTIKKIKHNGMKFKIKKHRQENIFYIKVFDWILPSYIKINYHIPTYDEMGGFTDFTWKPFPTIGDCIDFIKYDYIKGQIIYKPSAYADKR